MGAWFFRIEALPADKKAGRYEGLSLDILLN